MRFDRPLPLTAAQQFLLLRNNPLCEGDGWLHAGGLSWRFQLRPTPLSRCYTLRVEFQQGQVPCLYVDKPDLVLLSEDRRLPHVYSQRPTRLCLYLPRAQEWDPSMRLDTTIIPWAGLWLYYFEEWLESDEWKGGGVHLPEPKPRRHYGSRTVARGGEC